MKKHLLLIIRWIGFIPAAVTAYFLGYVIMKGLLYIGYAMFDTDSFWFTKIMVPGVGGWFSCYAFLVTGAFIVPKFRKPITLVMAFIAAIAGIVILGISTYYGRFRFDLLVSIIGQTVGLYTGCIAVADSSKSYLDTLLLTE